MKTAKIQRVALLDDGRFAVFPDRKDSSWQYIYREACGVYWNQHLGCFHSNDVFSKFPEQVKLLRERAGTLMRELDSSEKLEISKPK